MATPIKITAGSIEIEAELNESKTANSIAELLPIEAKARRWGQEIYLPISLHAELEEGARDILEAGELGYWPSGDALCIFFGPTPASQGDEIRAASDVNIIGKATGDLSQLTVVPDGADIKIEQG